MRWSPSGVVLVLLASAVVTVGCTQREASDPGSTQSPPAATASPVSPDDEPAPKERAGVVAKVPDHIRYGPGGVVVVRTGVETVVVDEQVEWAGSDGAGGIVYSIENLVWWQPDGNDDAIPIDAEGWFARSVDGRPALITRTDEMCSGDGEFTWLVLHDLASGDERLLACVGWGGDATVGVTDVGDGRYIVRWGMDLANHSTMGGLIIGEFGATGRGESVGPLSSGLDLPGNPYPDAQSCHALHEGEPHTACEVDGRLSPDGLLLASWYRPDFSIVVPPTEGMPLEVVADEPAWVARLDTLPAEVTVRELDTGIERYRTELAARSRIADFDGRFLVTSPLPRRHRRFLR